MSARAPLRDPLLTRSFLLVSASHFFHSLSINTYLHLPGFLKQAGATEAWIGVLYGATAATAIVARPLIGRTMDAWGRRRMILAGGALEVLMCCLYLTVHGLGPWVLFVRVGHGIAEATLFVSLFAFAAEIVPASRRIEGIGLFGVSGMLPIAFSSVLGDAILARSSYPALFLASALASLLALALSLPLAEPASYAGQERPRGIFSALVQRDLVPLWFMGITFATAVAAPVTFLKTFVMDRGMGTIGGFFSAYSLAAVAVRLGFGALPERVGPKRVLFPALACTALGCCLLAAAWNPRSIIAAGMLGGVGHGYAFPILLGFVVSRARPSERGAALSIFTAVFDAGTLLGAPLLGLVIEAAGYPVMFVAAAGVVVAGMVGFSAVDRG